MKSSIIQQLSSVNLHSPSLLQQTLPLYRKQLLQNLSISNSNRQSSSRIKQKYKNFGEEEFIKKLKHNSTKQIDRKSIKAIDRYLKQMNGEKGKEMVLRLDRVKSMEYLHNYTNQLKNRRSQNEQVVNERQDLMRNKTANDRNSQSQPYQRVALNDKNPSSPQVRSEQLIKHPKYQNESSQNYINTPGNQNISCSQEQNTIVESAKFYYPNQSKCSNQNQHKMQLNRRENDQSMSFRRKEDQCLDESLNDQQYSEQASLHEQEVKGYYESENHFYHGSNNTNKFPIANNNSIVHFHNLIKPNVNSQTNQQSQSQQSDQCPNQSRYSQKKLEDQLVQLRHQTQQQQQIIRLQQTMIQKLNEQLQKLLLKLEETNTIKETETNHHKIQNKTKTQPKAIQTESVIDEFKQKYNSLARELQQINKKTIQQQTFADSKVIETDKQWNQNFTQLKNLLSGFNTNQSVNQSYNQQFESDQSEKDCGEQKQQIETLQIHKEKLNKLSATQKIYSTQKPIYSGNENDKLVSSPLSPDSMPYMIPQPQSKPQTKRFNYFNLLNQQGQHNNFPSQKTYPISLEPQEQQPSTSLRHISHPHPTITYEFEEEQPTQNNLIRLNTKQLSIQRPYKSRFSTYVQDQENNQKYLEYSDQEENALDQKLDS